MTRLGRLLIIGFDGLDPVLVRRWHLHAFMLRHRGRHYVGYHEKIYTPIVWGTILTGVAVEKHGFGPMEMAEIQARALLGNGILWRLHTIKQRITRRPLGLAKLLLRIRGLSYAPTPRLPRHLLEKTFIEELRGRGYRVAAIEIPAYNEERNEYYREQLRRLVHKGLPENGVQKLVDEALRDTMVRFSKAISFIERGYDLVFVYTPLPDLAFHLYPYPRLAKKLKLVVIHEQLGSIIKPLLTCAEQQGYTVMIISDHGFDVNKYDHSEYGYWALSRTPPYYIQLDIDIKKNVVHLVERS